ncbi:THUMP and UPF0020 domain containing protein [Trichuris trichiura]|uniref:THUMP and UPF0020 domain containing protein n=1 Tax=Trichuris trichiura TaxID=36087 RepID=A0A077Z570_TRITR|nr:THUMP and UPF0020 domain containing protein [Trichuris trichiura]
MAAANRTFEGTVASGLEQTAVEEVQEKFQCYGVRYDRGHVYFLLSPEEEISKVLGLRSFNHLSIVLLDERDLDIQTDKEASLENVKRLVDAADWDQGLLVWQSVYGRQLGNGRNDEDSSGGFVPKFRVTCNRTGTQHAFTSTEAAGALGAAVVDKFGWKVDLVNFDVEVLLNIEWRRARIGLALTDRCLALRNLVSCGPTAMKATIAYGLLRLCKLQDNEIICDPMCGSGSIVLEAANCWSNCLYLAGDIGEQNVNMCCKNISSLRSLKSRVNIQLFRWDAKHLPLRNATVDCIITDLPYGKRSGSKWQNALLYQAVVEEVARVLRPGGRACLVTSDKRNLYKTLGGKMLSLSKVYSINVGGMFPTAFLLRRTSLEFDLRG